MKIKKILASAITGAILAGMAVIPVSAGTVTFLPSGSGSKYAIEVKGIAGIAEVKFDATHVLTFNNAGITGGTGTITNKDNNSTYTVKNVLNARVNNAQIVAGNPSITFGIQTKANMLPMGTYTRFEWTAQLILADETKHPVNDLGINLNNLSYNAGMSVPYAGSPQAIEFESYTAKVIPITDTTTFTKDTPIRVRDYINNGRGFTKTEKEVLRNADKFSVTVTLRDAVGANDIKILSFATDLTGKTSASAIAQSGARSVTFDPVPKSFFYDDVSAEIWGIDAFFETMYLGGASEFTSITINYVEGAASTTTTTTTTAKPGSTTTPPASSNEDVAESELSLNYNAVTLNKDAGVFLKASYDDVKWSKGGSDVVRVFTNGKVLGVKAGTATITATAPNGDKTTCKVTVIDSKTPITSYQLATTKGTVYVDSSYSISKASVTPSNNTDKITWTSSDQSIATVNSAGKVTVVGVGKVTITATTSSGKTSACVLTAKNPSLSLQSSAATIGVGGKVSISATAKPNSSNTTFESLNEGIATVNNSGVVTGVAKGSTKIEVTSNKGIVKIFTVTVK